MADPSNGLSVAFALFACALAAGVVWSVWQAGRHLREPRHITRRWTLSALAAVSLWLAGTWLVADSGVLRDFERRPPPMLLMFVVVLSVSAGFAFSRAGTRLVQGLPLWFLIAAQSFRLPLELLMHRAATEGVMPPQMSYSGLNFDILTGVLAIPVAWLVARGHGYARHAAWMWNVGGALLLANVLTIAMVSTPLAAAFGRDRLNVWVTYPPFVWLPTVMVVSAIAGHILVTRALRAPQGMVIPPGR